MTQVIRCHICNRKVGTREELILHIRKGCEVEILVTCANCLRPSPNPNVHSDNKTIDDLMGLFGMKK